MEQRLQDVLNGKGENYLLPFYWQHGETKELLEEGMERIFASGIRAVCVESRPHPDFVGDGWWRDLDSIMAKAKELGMRVWVLDDAHFPSGYVNGKIGKDSPYGKTYLTHYTIDALGPAKGNAFMVRLEPGEELLGVVLGKRSRTRSFYQTNLKDVTGLVRDGKVYLDIPEGVWCVNVIKTTKKSTGRPGYVNIIDKDAVRFFIDTVYEPHYAHYAADFGDTFAGFFSDEPELGNCGSEYIHDSTIGKPKMPLPWCDELKTLLKETWKEEMPVKLVSLWNDIDAEEEAEGQNQTGWNRRQYMDFVTDLYGRNFCGQIGDWCRAHRVEYIGHVIEDGGVHARLGLGTGHFFKALWGQDMSGIDVVLQQIRPQLDDFGFYSVGGTGFYYGEFFHYGLAKMGVSLGHLDPKKKGRTMCEVFGAYGWAEGLKLMKWLLDHMLVNGVNYYVPHAFTMKDYPDPDCPPHFYARGNNPQYPAFRDLMEYTNRISHLLNGGKHIPCAALLYSAELEWMGKSRMFESDAKELTRAQIDFEVVPEEIATNANIVDGSLIVGEEAVKAFIIPGCDYISKALYDACQRMAKAGILVYTTGKLPKILFEDGSAIAIEVAAAQNTSIVSVAPDELAQTLRAAGIGSVKTSTYEPWLRYYQYEQKDGTYFVWFNEGVTSSVCTTVQIPSIQGKSCYWYLPWENKLEACEWNQQGELVLQVAPYELKILYAGELETEIELEPVKTCIAKKEIPDNVWTLEVRKAGEDVWEKQTACENGSVLGDLGVSERMPYFSGIMHYKAVIDAGKEDTILDLGDVYETAEVWVNGQKAGVRVAPPYRFSIGSFMEDGENTIDLYVCNTLVNEQRDYFSMTLPMEPSGLLGPVSIESWKA